MAKSLDHETLGKIEGVTQNGATQYLGLKYGSLKDRFAEATLAEYPKGTTINATKTGPAVLSMINAVDMEQGLIQHPLPYPDRAVSDMEGLNLNISVPANADVSQKLPVFVFVHGGGFFIGCTSWPETDLARTVALSAAKGVPVIGVGINYRLGAPGFLTSAEMRKAGYKANNGLRDQRLALRWVRKHIAGFGGDADNVTLIGESAGAMSVAFHMQSEEALFKRAVLMSGSDILSRTKPLSTAQESYDTVLKILGLDSLSAQEQIDSLVSMPADDLLSKIPPYVTLGAVVDEDLILHRADYASVTGGSKQPSNKWLDSLMIGDCAFDGSITALFMGHRKTGIAKAFATSMEKHLPAEKAAALLDIYAISPSTADDAAFYGVLSFANDIDFYAPTLAVARGMPSSTPVYMYRFNEPNPWDGPSKGLASHVFDVALLFQNYNEFLEPGQRGNAEAFCEKFVRFVAGEKPWPAWRKGEDEVALVVGPETVAVKRDVPEETGRRGAFLKFAEEVGFDAVADAWSAFVQG